MTIIVTAVIFFMDWLFEQFSLNNPPVRCRKTAFILYTMLGSDSTLLNVEMLDHLLHTKHST